MKLGESAGFTAELVVLPSAVLTCCNIASGSSAYSSGVDSYSDGPVSWLDYCCA